MPVVLFEVACSPAMRGQARAWSALATQNVRPMQTLGPRGRVTRVNQGSLCTPLALNKAEISYERRETSLECR
jgi:hypothetical protein